MSEEKKSWADQEEEEISKELEKSVGIPTENPQDEDSPIPNLIKPTLEDLDKGVSVEVQQDDPNSPLFSAKTFEELNLKQELLKGVYAMGFNKPSKIQEKALPVILVNPPKNMIAQAQSGTGKTATFVLSMLSRCDASHSYPQAICLCPTRELARQIEDVVKMMGKFTSIKTILAVKDAPIPKKISEQIIVGTPGKVLDMMSKRAFNAKKVRMLILDEADHMIDRHGLGDQTLNIKRELHPAVQTLLFSATYKDNVRKYAERIVRQPSVKLVLKKEELTLKGILQLYIDCKSEDRKYNVLSDIYGFMSVGQSIIFVHTRKTAIELCQRMNAEGHTVSLLVGGEDMSSKDRDQVIDNFRKGITKVLITTNVLARGIDILAVMLVINYDLPFTPGNKVDPQTYLHRIGRSGRFGRKGIAINFVHDESSKRHISELEAHFGCQIKEFKEEEIEHLSSMLEDIQTSEQKKHLESATSKS